MEMALRASNLILPQGFVEMDCEEMMYVDGGVNFVRNGFYLSKEDLVITLGSLASMWTYVTQAVIAAKFIVSTSWLNSFAGVGTFIWGALGVSSIILSIYIISALSQNKGLEFTMSFTKIRFIPVPTGINITVK